MTASQGHRLTRHDPACITVTVWPATVSVPVRTAPLLFTVALTDTVPFPVPDEPDVMDNQPAFDDAVHAQPAPAVTVTGPLPPATPTITVVGATVNVHGTPSWLTVNVWPAIVSVPVRDGPVFAATVKPTGPLPVPDAPEVTTIHDAFEVAVHVQLAAAVTIADPVPPAAPTP